MDLSGVRTSELKNELSKRESKGFKKRFEFMSGQIEERDGKRGYPVKDLDTNKEGFFEPRGLENCVQDLLDAGHRKLCVEKHGGPWYVGKID